MKIIDRIITLIICSFVCFSDAHAQVPQRDWSTYFGGQLTVVHQVKVDTAHGCIIVCGNTADTTGIATPGAYKEHIYGLTVPVLAPEYLLFYDWDLFVAKFDLNGNLLWSTYYGGPGREVLYDVALDRLGNIYLTGQTFSATDIATSTGFLNAVSFPAADNFAPFLAKFSTDGNLLWGTYYGSSVANNSTSITTVATDTFNNVYIAGAAGDTLNIATPGAWQPLPRSNSDGFLAKFSASGTRLWSTYYGDRKPDSIGFNGCGPDMVIDKDNNPVFLGLAWADSADLGTPGVFLPTTDSLRGSVSYIAKFNSAGSRLWHTYLKVKAWEITSDELGNYFVYGSTSFQVVGVVMPWDSVNITTPGAYQEHYSGSQDMVLMKFSNAGHRIWSTYFGGSGFEKSVNSEFDVTIAPYNDELAYTPANGGAIYISGNTNSTTSIDNGCGYEPTTSSYNGFIAKFKTDGQLYYSGYYDDGIYSLSLNTNKNGQQEIYIGNRTAINGLATPGCFKDNKTGLLRSGLIAKFTESCPANNLVISYNSPILNADDGYQLYTWFHNDTLVHTDTSAYWEIADTTGNYYCVAEKCGCSYTSNMITFSPTGLGNLGQHQVLSIYPNPVSDFLLIDIKDLPTSAKTLYIYDVAGKLVKEQKLDTSRAEIKVSVSRLSKGFFIVKVQSDLGVFFGKFIKI